MATTHSARRRQRPAHAPDYGSWAGSRSTRQNRAAAPVDVTPHARSRRESADPGRKVDERR